MDRPVTTRNIEAFFSHELFVQRPEFRIHLKNRPGRKYLIKISIVIELISGRILDFQPALGPKGRPHTNNRPPIEDNGSIPNHTGDRWWKSNQIIQIPGRREPQKNEWK
jgi:hypothetical protein